MYIQYLILTINVGSDFRSKGRKGFAFFDIPWNGIPEKCSVVPEASFHIISMRMR